MYYPLRFSYVSAFILVALVVLFTPRHSLAAEITITISNNAYTPKSVTIHPGDTVRWINNGSSAHTVTADDGSFDSVSLTAGQSFAAVFNIAGNYPYYCRHHGGKGGVGQSGAVSVVAPPPVPTSNTPSLLSLLQAQVQGLMNQVNVLKAQPVSSAGSAAQTSSSACPLVGRVLKRGTTGEDVTRLQQFLARDPSVYPEGTVSGYYGALTERAVQRWQVKYNIVSSGTPGTTGYGVVGPRTAAAIALLCTTGSYGGVPAPVVTNAPAQVGALLTVSPITGSAPLIVKVTATVNTTNSCQAATYLLDFGDGSLQVQVPVVANTCQPITQTPSHTYKYGGTYTVKLSAQGHETTATVTVDGPPPPVITPGLPKESFNVTPLSGAAPLTVTFSGVVNSNDAGFCEDGCASVLDFGDGNQATVNLPGSVGGWLNYSVTHTYTQSGGFRATLYQGGAGASQPIVGSATIIVGFGVPPTTQQTPPPTTTVTTGTSTSYSYNLPVVAPYGDSPLRFSISFDLPSSCSDFSLDWGDGYSGIEQTGAGSCAQNVTQKTYVHLYAESGTYNITLRRGAGFSRVDQSTLTIVSSN